MPVGTVRLVLVSPLGPVLGLAPAVVDRLLDLGDGQVVHGGHLGVVL